MGAVEGMLGQYEKALGYLERAVAISARMHDHKMEGMVLEKIADVYTKLGQNEKASSYHERSISTMKQQ
ncbi:MAG: tetratricopeptide repeat protein [Syntrophobacteraceae bacterium]